MPVTAKLSQEFYEKLGDKVVNELVNLLNLVDANSRSDLRELNEGNFARFDAKVEQRFAESDARLEKRFAEAEVRLEKRFAEAEVRLEKRFAEAEVRLEKRFAEFRSEIEKRFAESEEKVGKRLAAFETRIETRLSASEAKNDARFDALGKSVVAFRDEMQKMRADLTNKMFLFWSGTTIPLAALMYAMLHGR